MILTCPECSTRYSVDSASFSGAGRKVRCIKCGHTWLQPPPDDLPKTIEEPPPLAAAPEDIDVPMDRPAPPRTPRRPPAGERSGRGGGAWLAWLLLIVIVGGVVGGGLAFQKDIETLWPPAEQIYALIGFAPDPPGYVLDLRNVTYKQVTEGERHVFQVQGQIVNTTEEVRDVPDLKGILFDDSNKELQRWTFQASEARLLPGEAVVFKSEIADPSPQAAKLTIVFDDKT